MFSTETQEQSIGVIKDKKTWYHYNLRMARERSVFNKQHGTLILAECNHPRYPKEDYMNTPFDTVDTLQESLELSCRSSRVKIINCTWQKVGEKDKW
jgi:hypothetical protein